MKKYDTRIMSWGPLAEGRNHYFTNGTLVTIGNKYGKTAAQVALRFLTQEGIIAIPKTVRQERMKENIDIFDFTLTRGELQAIGKLDRNETLFF